MRIDRLLSSIAANGGTAREADVARRLVPGMDEADYIAIRSGMATTGTVQAIRRRLTQADGRTENLTVR
jgi:hypothetical protein